MSKAKTKWIEDEAITKEKLNADVAGSGLSGGAGTALSVDSGADGTALHDNVAGEVNAISSKITPHNGDILVIEDYEDGWKKKKVLMASVKNDNAVHVNVNSEIVGVTNKATPVDNDVILIEDSAASYAKKHIKISDLPGGGGGFPVYTFFADQMITPDNSSWYVQPPAELDTDSVTACLKNREFDDTTNEGAGFPIYIPAGATNIIFEFCSRAQASAASNRDVIVRMCGREIQDNGIVEGWSTSPFAALVMGTSNTHYQYDTVTKTIATFSASAERMCMFEVTREATSASDNLVGDWNLAMLNVRFS